MDRPEVGNSYKGESIEPLTEHGLQSASNKVPAFYASVGAVLGRG